MRTRVVALLSVFLSAAFVAPVAAEVAPVRVAEGVYTFTGTFANSTALVTPEGVLVVDCGENPQVGEELLEAVKTLGEPRYLVYTHWHWDHVAGGNAFAKAGAVIIASGRTRESLASKVPLNGSAPLPPEALPAITFDESLTLRFGGEVVLIRHPAGGGQTSGDAFVVFRNAKVVVTGDICRNGAYNYIDAADGGSAAAMAAACREALTFAGPGTVVIPGHGAPMDAAGLDERARMLEDVDARVSALMDEGLGEAQIVAARPTAAWDAAHATDPAWTDEFVRLVRRGVEARREREK
jgi:glyoxylase-like metal-dependent hydrolase (beta-lactamase superfamily II)